MTGRAGTTCHSDIRSITQTFFAGELLEINSVLIKAAKNSYRNTVSFQIRLIPQSLQKLINLRLDYSDIYLKSSGRVFVGLPIAKPISESVFFLAT